MEPGKHTVYDIARLAGVSPATVSRVITGATKVSPDKEKRVREVMELVNFRPNAFARTLLTKKSSTLGVIMPDITNLFFSQTFLALERAAALEHYSLLLGNTLSRREMPGEDWESYYLNSLLDRQVDGILFMGGRVNDVAPAAEQVAELIRLGRQKPIVLVNGRCPGTELRTVCTDEQGGVRALLEHLFSLGHRRIGVLGGYAGITSFEDKLATVTEGLRGQGLELRPDWVRPTGYSLESGFAAMEELLALPERPTAVVGINDYVAMGAIRCATVRGLRIPGDLAITGFDGIQTAAYSIPSLTTVDQNYDELAAAAVRILLAQVNGGATPKDTTVPATLVIRESTGPARA